MSEAVHIDFARLRAQAKAAGILGQAMGFALDMAEQMPKDNQALRAAEAERDAALAEVQRLREAVNMALPLLEVFKENLDHLTCGDLCDASHEFRGCRGRCALDASKDTASKAIAAARALVEAP